MSGLVNEARSPPAAKTSCAADEGRCPVPGDGQTARARVRRADGAETWTSLPFLNGRLTTETPRRGRFSQPLVSSRRRGRFVFVVAARGWWTRHTATRAATERRERASSRARADPVPRLNLRRRCPAVVRSRSSPSVSRLVRDDAMATAGARPPRPIHRSGRTSPELSAAIEAESGATLTEFPSALVAHAVDQSRLAGNRAFASGLHPKPRLYRPSPAPPTTARSTPTAAPPTSPRRRRRRASRRRARAVAIDPNWPKAHYRLGRRSPTPAVDPLADAFARCLELAQTTPPRANVRSGGI